MQHSTLPKDFLEQRLQNVFVLIKSISILFGLGAIISQLLQISPLLESYPGWNITWGQGATILVGCVFLWFGLHKHLKNRLSNWIIIRKHKTKQKILLVPFVFVAVVVILKVALGNTDDYIEIYSEGGLFEYGTVFAFFIATGIGILIARCFFQKKQFFLGGAYCFYSFCFFVVGGEEVSWGQRLFGWQLPEFFEEYNVKGELTLHNLVWLNDYWGDGIILICALIALGVLYALIRQKDSPALARKLKYLIPGSYLLSFFGVAMIIYILVEIQYATGNLPFAVISTREQEFAEFLFSMGFLLFATANYFRQGTEYTEQSQRFRGNESA
ncbi:hypothetical protein FEK30_01625 [Picosynechococcus sp. PCC 11901]|uniref:hypothetical protein n=1 Tax=Picosynechococcus sp. PCC 11901 TaxID=2579791 RepID=UPI0010FC2B19|nr:hypothetical protein [Picosynechococcus sp. PCC 11901]QCS48238.1 hypothetical protein FEK30_01625 [Picosynechococcus sp. PCC 11901]